jgi:hypothetical protein
MLNAPISQQLAAARLASRKISYQAENNALVASIIQHGVTAIVGDGPTVLPAHPGSEIADRRGWPPGAGGGVLDPVFKYQIEPGELPVHT